MIDLPRHDERSVGDVLQDIFSNIQDIIRSEVRLAQAEFKTEASQAAKAGKPWIAGAVLSFYAGGLFLLGLVYALALVMQLWLASLVVGVVVALIAAALITSGRRRLRDMNPAPEKTIETLKEDVRWLKDQTR